MSITYTVQKKENALIIHRFIVLWKYTFMRNFNILFLCFFSKFSKLLSPSLTQSQVRHW